MASHRSLTKSVISCVALGGLLLSTTPTLAAPSLPNFTPNDGLVLSSELTVSDAKISGSLKAASGPQDVIVRLAAQPSGRAAAGTQAEQARGITAQQDAVINSIRAIDPSATVLGRTRVVLNAVMMRVDASKLKEVSKDTRVTAINPVTNYELDLTQTVPYIGGTAAQPAGSSGAGVSVAVLDSGIDYTHVAFGGAGTAAARDAAYGTSITDPRTTTRDGLFPTSRVVEGYDFVGEAWPNGPLQPDDDPIDCGATVIAGCAGGHGTHVADIIGGALGVAPQVDLYAVKVCSAVSTSCSGTAILQGIDYAADPNGDGDTSDRVDIINMSLGSPYGQNYDEDSAIAVDNATAVGILTVASAGNSADKPYITGTPAGARTALSVAQTEVPSSKLQNIEILTPAAIAGTIGALFQPWSTAPSSTITGPVQFGDGAGGNTLGCNPFPAGSLAGKIVLVDRGTCSGSIKISNIAAGGALAGIIGLVAPGDPFTFAFGGGTPTVPGYMIRQVDSNKIKSQLANGVTLRIDPNNQTSLSGTVVGSSSRGPAMGQMFYGNTIQYGQIIKPEIGAPGASISAISGTGTGTEAFGGTSGAAPMVAGSAALLKNVQPFVSPQELKAILMNNAETQVFNAPAIFGGGLAPITRIGGGEVRVNRAVEAKAAAWERDSRNASLSFGFADVTGVTTIKRTVVVRNYSNSAVTYTITPGFRFNDDATNAAVTPSAPATISVPKNSSRNFTLTLTIDGSKLRDWGLLLGPTGADATTLTTFEYDGYVTLTPNSGSYNTINLPWHVLPRKAAKVSGPTSVRLNTPAAYTNTGVATAQVDTFALVGTNSFDQASGPAGAGQPVTVLKNIGVATYNGAGICPGGGYLLRFAVNTFARTTTPQAPYQARINLDTNRDGVADFQVRNADATLNNLTDGRNYSWVVNLRTGSGNALFFTEHHSNTANMVLTACSSQLADATRPGGALAAPALGSLVNATAESYENYFFGVTMSSIGGIVFSPGGEKYAATIADIPAGGSSSLTVTATGSTAATTEKGVLLLLDGQRGNVKNGNPEGKEVIAVTVR